MSENNENIIKERVVKSPKLNKGVDKRAKSLKWFSIGSVIMFIAILLVVNILLDIALSGALTFDYSQVKMNSVSKATKEYLNTLEQDIEIVGLVGNPEEQEWYEYVCPLLDDYVAKSHGHISVRYVDPNENPFIITELDPNGVLDLSTNLSKGLFVFKMGDQTRLLTAYDCFDYDQDYYSYYGVMKLTANNVELNVTGLLMTLTTATDLHAYFLQDHQESGHTYLDTLLEAMGFTTADLSIAGDDGVPENCDLLFINLPMQDITVDEVDKITTYISQGGNVIIANDASLNMDVQYPNLNALMQVMGITMDEAVIHENDVNYLYTSTDPYQARGVIEDTYANYSSVGYFRTAYARPVREFDNPFSYISVSPMIVSSATATMDTSEATDTTGLTAGTYNYAMYSQNTGYSETAEMIVFGTRSFTGDDYYATFGLSDANVGFVKSCISSMVNQTIEVPVSSKEFPKYTLTDQPTSNALTFWSILLVAVVPLAALGSGLFIYNKRKHM
ncbi:MAG TPA: Gldg family protein [Bacillota bacterium]|nr:Gldg family protein [Bacillota bacterium]